MLDHLVAPKGMGAARAGIPTLQPWAPTGDAGTAPVRRCLARYKGDWWACHAHEVAPSPPKSPLQPKGLSR